MILIKKTPLFIIVFMIASIFYGTIATGGNKIELTKGQIDLLSSLQKQQLIVIEANLNRAYIDPSLWNSMKYNIKENFTASLAVFCGNEKGTYLYWVELYDQYSGKKLAKYSQSWGFKVY